LRENNINNRLVVLETEMSGAKENYKDLSREFGRKHAKEDGNEKRSTDILDVLRKILVDLISFESFSLTSLTSFESFSLTSFISFDRFWLTFVKPTRNC